LLATALLSVAIVYEKASRGFSAEFSADVIRLAQAAASQVDGDLHAKITTPEQQNGEAYQRAVAPLRRMLQATGGVKYIYTAIEREGRVYFILDSADAGDSDGDGRDDQAKVMEEYQDADPQMLECFATGRSGATQEPYWCGCRSRGIFRATWIHPPGCAIRHNSERTGGVGECHWHFLHVPNPAQS